MMSGPPNTSNHPRARRGLRGRLIATVANYVANPTFRLCLLRLTNHR
jgi:hypothetical protein